MRSSPGSTDRPLAEVIPFKPKGTDAVPLAKERYERTLLDAVGALDDMNQIVFATAVRLACSGPLREWAEAQEVGCVATFSGDTLIASGDPEVAELALVHRRLWEALEHFRACGIDAVAARAEAALALGSESERLWVTSVGCRVSWVTGKVGFTNIAPGLSFSGDEGVFARDLDADLAALRDAFEPHLLINPMGDLDLVRFGLTRMVATAEALGMYVLTMPVDASIELSRLDSVLALGRVVRQAMLSGKTVVVLSDVRTDRAAALVASILALLGVPAARAVTNVRAAKGGALASKRWVHFVHALAARAEQLGLVLDVDEQGEGGE